MSDLKIENKYVFLLAAIQFAHIVDFVILMPLGPTLILDFGISPAQFGSLVSSYNFSAALTGLLFSTIADRFDRKKLLDLCMIGFIVGTILCGLAPTFTLLLLGRILTGVFGGILNILVFALVTDLVPFERRGNAMGVVMASFSVASVLGIPIGLGIADFISWHWTFFFIAFFSSFIAFAAWRILPNRPVEKDCTPAKEVLLRFVILLKRFDYLRAYGLILMTAMSMFFIIPFLSPYAVHNMGVKTEQLKYMYLIAGLVTIVTARLIGKFTDRSGSLKVFSTIAVCSIIPIWFYTNSGILSFPVYLVLSALFMSLVSGRMIPVMTMVSQVPDQKDRGTFMGLLNSLRSFGTASATLMAGLIISEDANGNILGFDRVGYITISLTVLSIFVAASVFYKSKNIESTLKKSVV